MVRFIQWQWSRAIHITGRANYQAFSDDYMGDERIITDGALVAGQNHCQESAGFYWSDETEDSRMMIRYDLNKMLDENASVEVITRISMEENRSWRKREGHTHIFPGGNSMKTIKSNKKMVLEIMWLNKSRTIGAK